MNATRRTPTGPATQKDTAGAAGPAASEGPPRPAFDAAAALDFAAELLRKALAGRELGRALATVYRDIRCALCAALQQHLGEPVDLAQLPGAARLDRLLDLTLSRLAQSVPDIVALLPLLRDLPDAPDDPDWRRDSDEARRYVDSIDRRVSAASRLMALLYREPLAAQGIADGLWLTAPRHLNCVDEYLILDLFCATGPSLWHMQRGCVVSRQVRSLFDPRYFAPLTDPARLRICEASLVCPVRFSERAGIAPEAPSSDPDFDTAPVVLRCSVAGIQYGALPAADKLPEPGMWLRLQRQPDNPYDRLAVRVVTPGGLEIGYLPRDLNENIAGRLDQGVKLRSRLLGWQREFDQGTRPRVAVDIEVRSLLLHDSPDERERNSLEGWLLTDIGRRVPQPRCRIGGTAARDGRGRLRASLDRSQARKYIAESRWALGQGDLDAAVAAALKAAESLACVWLSRHDYGRLFGPIDRLASLVRRPDAPVWAYTLVAACQEVRLLRRPADLQIGEPLNPPSGTAWPLEGPRADPKRLRRALELVGRIDALVQSVIGDPRDPLYADTEHIVVRAPRRVPDLPSPERPAVLDLPQSQRAGLMRTLRRLTEITERVEAGLPVQRTALRCLPALSRHPVLEWEVLQRVANQENAHLETWDIEAVDPRLAAAGVTSSLKSQWIERIFDLIERPWLDRDEARWLPTMLRELQPGRGRRRVVLDALLFRVEALVTAAAPKLDRRLYRLALDYAVVPAGARAGQLDAQRLRWLTEALCIETTGFDCAQLSGLYPPLTDAPLPWPMALAAWERSLSAADEVAPRLRPAYLAAARMQLETSLVGSPARVPRRVWNEAARLDAVYLAMAEKPPAPDAQSPDAVLSALMWW
jgi:hypothetical protein